MSVELGWAAGFFDGEGTTYAANANGRRYATVTITNTNREALERFAEAVGFGKIYERGPQDGHLGSKQLYIFRLHNRGEVAQFERLVYPLLCQEKRDQFDAARALEAANDPVDRTAAWRTRRERYGESGRRDGDQRIAGQFAATVGE